MSRSLSRWADATDDEAEQTRTPKRSGSTTATRRYSSVVKESIPLHPRMSNCTPASATATRSNPCGPSTGARPTRAASLSGKPTLHSPTSCNRKRWHATTNPPSSTTRLWIRSSLNDWRAASTRDRQNSCSRAPVPAPAPALTPASSSSSSFFSAAARFETAEGILKHADEEAVEYDTLLSCLREFYGFTISFRAARALVHGWSLASPVERDTYDWQSLFHLIVQTDALRTFEWAVVYDARDLRSIQAQLQAFVARSAQN